MHRDLPGSTWKEGLDRLTQAFTAAIMAGVEHKARPADDFFSEVLEVLSEVRRPA